MEKRRNFNIDNTFAPGGVLDKTKKHNYSEMWHKHIKELTTLSKKATPFQADDGLKIFVEYLRFLRDYYKLGYNVWAMERKDEDPKRYKNQLTRYESLELTLAEYDAWKGCEDKYFIYHETGGIVNGKGLKFWSEDPNNSDASIQCQDDSWIEELLPDHKENLKAYKKEYNYHKTQFFKLINKWFDEWWD